MNIPYTCVQMTKVHFSNTKIYNLQRYEFIHVHIKKYIHKTKKTQMDINTDSFIHILPEIFKLTHIHKHA